MGSFYGIADVITTMASAAARTAFPTMRTSPLGAGLFLDLREVARGFLCAALCGLHDLVADVILDRRHR